MSDKQDLMVVDRVIDGQFPTWSGRMKSLAAAEREPYLDCRKVARPRCIVKNGDAQFIVHGLLTASAGLLLAEEILRQGKRRDVALWIDSRAGQVAALTPLLPAVSIVARKRLVGAYVFCAFGPALVLARHCSALLGRPQSRVGMLACRLPFVGGHDPQIEAEHWLDQETFFDHCQAVRHPIVPHQWYRLQTKWLNGEQAEASGILPMATDGPDSMREVRAMLR